MTLSDFPIKGLRFIKFMYLAQAAMPANGRYRTQTHSLAKSHTLSSLYHVALGEHNSGSGFHWA